jgi:hypothetical protein
VSTDGSAAYRRLNYPGDTVTQNVLCTPSGGEVVLRQATLLPCSCGMQVLNANIHILLVHILLVRQLCLVLLESPTHGSTYHFNLILLLQELDQIFIMVC